MIDGQNFFDQPVKNDLRTYGNIQKITIGQEDDDTTGCLLDHIYFKENYKFIATDLSKYQALDADPKAMQQMNLKGNLARYPIANTTMFFIIAETKETILDFSQGTVKV